MASKLFSFFTGAPEAEDKPQTAQLASATPEELFDTCKQLGAELEKVKSDKLYIENRLRDDIEMHRALNAELKQTLRTRDEEVAKLAKEVESARGSAAEEARKLIARAGHDPVAIDSKSDPSASEDEKIVAEYKALLPGPDRIAFRAKHKKVLIEALGAGTFPDEL